MVAVDLETFLGQCYKADVLKGDKAALNWLLTSSTADDLKAEAKLKLPQLEAVNKAGQRCFISQKKAEYLRRMLA